MSHRIKRFAKVADFARFYLFAAVDPILDFGGHHVDTKTAIATTELSLSDELVFGSLRPAEPLPNQYPGGSPLRKQTTTLNFVPR
jgi:hypothetical protein